jgi:hypothetical protein
LRRWLKPKRVAWKRTLPADGVPAARPAPCCGRWALTACARVGATYSAEAAGTAHAAAATPKHLAPLTKRGTPPIGYAGCETPKCLSGSDRFLHHARSRLGVTGGMDPAWLGPLVRPLRRGRQPDPRRPPSPGSSVVRGSGSAAFCSGRSRTPSRTWRCRRSSVSHSARRSGPPRLNVTDPATPTKRGRLAADLPSSEPAEAESLAQMGDADERT